VSPCCVIAFIVLRLLPSGRFFPWLSFRNREAKGYGLVLARGWYNNGEEKATHRARETLAGA